MQDNFSKIKDILLIEPRNQGEIAARVELSQPQVSNYLRNNPDVFLRTGSARATRYYLRRVVFGEHSWLVYRVTAQGNAEHFADLHCVYPSGFVTYLHKTHSWEHHDSLPWWMADMRPQGFMGRSLARQLSAEMPDLAPDPRDWSDIDTLRMLTTHPQDGIGNLLIGRTAYELWLNETTQTVVQQADLPQLAEHAMAGWFGGSSAGGEQPKFACSLTEAGNHCLVKFTAPLTATNANATRWADLLIAEHTALTILHNAGIVAARSEPVRLEQNGTTRQFLIVQRFDREGAGGRRGIVSLRMLDAEFVGSHSQRWPVIAGQLAAQNVIKAEDLPAIQLLFCFGRLIANSDMHAGNLSFLHEGTRPLGLAPAYDMLPMAYAPNSNGDMRQGEAPLTIDSDLDGTTWRQALTLALLFWETLAAQPDLSDAFRTLAQQMQAHLQGEITQKIMRMA
ncbi:MAG: type II toxin-antitoxin system HipA family toxinoxin YjjJ [Gammaproteobacteria bacterium]|nr:type II toxin-antitoxin system HipA family toxinoxin YjjJ [Gammaproteobacteria bacterium]